MSKRNTPVRSNLDPALLDSYHSIFDRFDPNDTGLVDNRHVAWMVRLVGRTPSNQEIDDIVAELTASTGASGISFEQFLEVIDRPPLYAFSEKDIRNAFRTFDVADRGFVQTHELCSHLESLAERLNVDEAMEFLRLADYSGVGRIDYEHFLTRSFSTRPVGQAKGKRGRTATKLKQQTVSEVAMLDEAEQIQTSTPGL